MTESTCQTTPEWTIYLQAIGPVLIGIFIAFVAWNQWKTNNDRLRHELFEKRWDVFNFVYKLLGEVELDSIGLGKEEQIDVRRSLEDQKEHIWPSHFLLDKDLSDFIEYVTRNVYWIYHRQEIEERIFNIDGHAVNEWAVLKRTELIDRFRPYLGIYKIGWFTKLEYRFGIKDRPAKFSDIEKDLFKTGKK